MAQPKPAMLIACLPLLKAIREHGPQGVYADNLIIAGMAVEGGYAVAEDTNEGPELRLTTSGLRATT